jgi:hypothetical protein
MQALDSTVIDGLRVTVYYDEDGGASNPRENENIARIYGRTSRYNVGDGEPPADEQDALDRGGLRLLARYLRMSKGVVALRAVNVYDHSGVSYSTGPIENAGRSGWDSYTAGYAYVTREAWDETGRSDDPTAPYVTDERDDASMVRTLAGLTNAEAMIEYEVREFGQWANGEVYGYVVERAHCDAADCPHDEEVESCWGFIGDSDYAMSEGKEVAASFARHEATAVTA